MNKSRFSPKRFYLNHERQILWTTIGTLVVAVAAYRAGVKDFKEFLGEHDLLEEYWKQED